MSKGTESGIEAIHALTFRVFFWVAGADDEMSPKEVDVYLRMVRSPGWAKSAWAKANLPRAAELYTRLWKQLHDGELVRDSGPILRTLATLRPTLDADEAAAVAEDLRKLGSAIARASGGFVGIGAISKEEQDALDQLEAIYAETLLADASAPSKGKASDAMKAKAAAMAAAATAAPAHVLRQSHGGTLRSVWTKGPIVVRCVRIFDEARDTKTFRFVGKAPVQFSYTAGQAGVLEVEIDGKKVYRSYTIASSPSRPDCIEFTIKRVPGGLVSNWLHDELREGDELVLSGPSGKFSCCFQRPEKVLMISAGSGITPLMSMTRWLYDTGDASDVVFLHSARTAEDLIFRRELELYAARHPSFRLVFTLTREPPPGWEGCTGRLDAALVREQVPDFLERTVYLCGPEGFMEGTRAMLEEIGFPMERYFSESFGGVPKKPRKRKSTHSKIMELWPTPAGLDRSMVPEGAIEAREARLGKQRAARRATPQLVFAESGHELDVADDVTILDAADEVGVSIPNACRSGVCGTCKVRMVAGQVEMTCEDGIEEHEREMGFVLACVARCRGKVEVDA